MKKSLYAIFVSLLLIVGGVSLPSCGKDGNTFGKEAPGATESKADTLSLNNWVDEKGQLSIVELNKLVVRIDSLSAQQKTGREEIENLNTTIKEMKESIPFPVILSLVIATFSLIVAILALFIVSRMRGKLKKYIKDEISLRFKERDDSKYSSCEQGNSSVSSTSYANLLRKFNTMEDRLDEMMRLTSKALPPRSTTQRDNSFASANRSVKEQTSPVGHSHESHIKEEKGYFGLPVKMSPTESYFKKYTKERDTDSRFAVFVRDDKAIFEPEGKGDELSYIVTSDSMRLAFDFHGCSPRDAKHMQIEEKGEASFIGGRWVITKKVKIRLSK